MSGRRLDASGLRDWAHAAVGALVIHAEEINRLNVFPVADADTGANMLFTMRAAVAEVDQSAHEPHGRGDVAQVAAAMARGALAGARGNSGMILSQILRGFADVVAAAAADTGGEIADLSPGLFAAALRHAVGLAGSSMGAAVDGTIVSVLQSAAGAAEHRAADGDDMPAVVVGAADAAVAALEHTPAQLDVLAEAGVVDAGGLGLVVVLDALAATLTGHSPVRREYVPDPAVGGPKNADAEDVKCSPHYEVMYQMGGCDAEQLDGLRGQLERLGESVAIASDGAGRHSVHVHADDAGAAVEVAFAYGTPSNIQISALSAGAAPGRWSRRRAVLAVVDGAGAEQLFADEGAHVLRLDDRGTGQAPRVSAKQLLQAVVDTGAGQITVLPNGYVAVEELVGRLHGGDWLGSRRCPGAHRIDGAGTGRAGRARTRPRAGR